jgi:hypothetical protein
LNAPASTEVRVNHVTPGVEGALRPDLVIIDEAKKTVAIVDVTVPFENGYEAFQAARREKKRKYAPPSRSLYPSGVQRVPRCLHRGSTGWIGPGNEVVIRHLRLGYQYCKLMRKLMVSDTLRLSRDVYVEHITGEKRYQDTA